MSKYTPDLQAWFDQTQPIDSGLVPDDSVYLPAAEVKDLILNNAKETAILDLRKGDFTGGKIKGAFNIPAQGIHNSIQDLYDLFAASGKKSIIIYCRSSRDRAIRVWGWFEQIARSKNQPFPKPFILKGGFNGWVAEGQEYIDLVDDYSPA